MIDFSLKRISKTAPYDITLSEVGFIFRTEKGNHYRISFDKEDIVFGDCETYQLIIQNVEHKHLPHDPKVETTILAIINEFFRSNTYVLLYICDTSDGREQERNRLFLRWFEKHAEPGRFTIRTANAIIEGEGFYAAIIVENRNPKIQAVTTDFEETARTLSQKPT